MKGLRNRKKGPAPKPQSHEEMTRGIQERQEEFGRGVQEMKAKYDALNGPMGDALGGAGDVRRGRKTLGRKLNAGQLQPFPVHQDDHHSSDSEHDTQSPSHTPTSDSEKD
jgi:hypothetical protein